MHPNSIPMSDTGACGRCGASPTKPDPTCRNCAPNAPKGGISEAVWIDREVEGLMGLPCAGVRGPMQLVANCGAGADGQQQAVTITRLLNAAIGLQYADVFALEGGDIKRLLGWMGSRILYDADRVLCREDDGLLLPLDREEAEAYERLMGLA